MKLFLLFFSILFSYHLSGQDFLTKDQLDKRSNKIFIQAQRFANVQQWSEAVKCLDQLLERKPNAIDALLLRAGIQYDQNKLATAEKDYEAVLLLSTNHAPITYYQLAVTEYRQEKYTEALEHFEAYLTMVDPEDKRKKRAEVYLAKAEIGAQLKSKPVPFEPQSLGDSINTKGKEYLPSFTADGRLLVYTVNYDGQEDFYFSLKNEVGNWMKGKPFDEINSPANEGAQSIAVDGRTLVFTGCQRKDGLGSCDLYYTERKNGEWKKTIHPETPLNSPYWESQPSLSANGQWLFFASDRPGGLGGNDIWVSGRKTDGQWGKPINLGAPINTAGNDESPFIHPDGQTLYFMSDGHPGLGGYDLFLARLENGQYTPPQNLGYPINTSASEGALVVSLDGKTAYYTTNTHSIQGQKQDFDIYQFPLHTAAQPKAVTYVSGQVTDAKTDKVVPNVYIQVKGENSNQSITNIQTDEKGHFLVVLPAGKNYQFLAKEEGYIFFSERFEMKDTHSVIAPFKLDIALQPITNELADGKEIILRNVLFDSNSDQLLESSTQELDQLTNLLKENPTLEIRINGHTDNIGQAEDNLHLSERRAEAVKQFLINAGIAATRLTAKGFGETQPITDNSDEIGRSKNRRTSFEVVAN